MGAVIVSNKDNSILSTGYNGAPAGMDGCLTKGNCPRGQKSYEEIAAFSPYGNCIAYHAEHNALRYAHKHMRWQGRLDDARIYITCDPCPDCFKLIQNAWVKTIITPTMIYTFEAKET